MSQEGTLAGLISMRPFTGQAQQEGMRHRIDKAFGHMLPDSVLVAAMSNHWQPGSWQKVSDMVMATNKAGVMCGFQEIQDRCLDWGDALGTMRNEAILMAQNEGFEWLCYVDNDVYPEGDVLLKLIHRNLPVIAPYVAEPGTGKRLHGPECAPNTGLHLVRWTVLSMVLFRTNVFNCFGHGFWSDAIGADEGYHFHLLWHYGHQLWLDTDAILEVRAKPTYPLASNRMEWGEREKYWGERRQHLMRPPDRRPIDPSGPYVTKEGDYMPFISRASADLPEAREPVTVGSVNAIPISDTAAKWEEEW